MKFIVHAFIVIALASTQALASDALALSGVVTDAKSHAPIERAQVSAVGGRAIHDEVTDANGVFVLTFVETVKPGDIIRLRVLMTGYETYDENVAVPAGGKLPKPISLRRIPANGSRWATPKSEASGPKANGDPGTYPIFGTDNVPNAEKTRRVFVIREIQIQYAEEHPANRQDILDDVEKVPRKYIDAQLEKRGEKWRVGPKADADCRSKDFVFENSYAGKVTDNSGTACLSSSTVGKFAGNTSQPPSPPVVIQNSPGSAVSVNQQGGITAGTVNYGPPPADFTIRSVRLVDSDIRGTFETQIEIVPSSSVPSGTEIELEFSAPVISVRFDITDADAELAVASTWRGKYATVGVPSPGITPTHTGTITAYSSVPLVLIGTPRIKH